MMFVFLYIDLLDCVHSFALLVFWHLVLCVDKFLSWCVAKSEIYRQTTFDKNAPSIQSHEA